MSFFPSCKNSIRHHLSFLKINQQDEPCACLAGYRSPEEEYKLVNILKSVGYKKVYLSEETSAACAFKYNYIKASGMLKLIPDQKSDDARAPRWVPVQSGEENVLVANGWSFLDPDESEPISAFDVDAANAEGQYIPKWILHDDASESIFELSDLGFNICRISEQKILQESFSLTRNAKSTLLEGSTDKPNVKVSNNGVDLTGAVYNIIPGVFTCALVGLPLFTTADLMPTTGSSGWLSFSKPIDAKHIIHIQPARDSVDRRIEVICAKTRCHLGHYFGSDGYCINASSLNYFEIHSTSENFQILTPSSWLRLQTNNYHLSPSERLLKEFLSKNTKFKQVFLGAGCFWHLEFALRQLPGVYDTKCCFAGGNMPSATYKQVCDGQTGHAEVVKLIFDPKVCDPWTLFDCFLALHDPTSLRAHGERSHKHGQYRSCIFFDEDDKDLESIAVEAIEQCGRAISKAIITEVRQIPKESWCEAEITHQRREERIKKKSGEEIRTLPLNIWLMQYGRRISSTWESSSSVIVDDEDDNGMARQMI